LALNAAPSILSTVHWEILFLIWEIDILTA